MDKYSVNESIYDYEDNYKSYEGYSEEYNPDDYESDYWEDMLPDVDRMAEDFERSMENQEYYDSGNYYYSNDLSVEELDRMLDAEFYS